MKHARMIKALASAILLLASALPVLGIGEVPPDAPVNSQAAADFTVQPYAEAGASFSRPPFSLSAQRGRLVILHFWQASSASTSEDLRLLQQVGNAYDSQTLQILGINPSDQPEAVLNLLASQSIYFANAADDGAIASAYQVESLPSSLLIDAQGRISARLDGPLESASLNALLGNAGLSDFTQLPIVDAPIPAESAGRYIGLQRSITPEGYPRLGRTDTDILVEDFGSFSCPVCQRYHSENIDPILQIIRDEGIAYIYVPIYSTGSIPNGFFANMGAMCAADQGRFWEYADALYDWHERFSAEAFSGDRLRQGAVNLSLDIADWEDCMRADKNERILETALEVFRERAYTGTPTITVNGRPVRAQLDDIRDAINRLIRDRI